MSDFSRVKKNQNLYKEIIEEDKTKIIESSLRDYERRTNKPHHDDSKYQASRYRKSEHLQDDKSSIQDEQIEPVKEEQEFVQKEILRDRDLLEEFIEEVKHYNINRGLRNVQDTQMNILQNLGKTPVEQTKNQQDQDLEKSTSKENEHDLTREIQAIIAGLDTDFESEEENDEFIFAPLDEENKQKLSTIFDEIEENSDKPKRQEKSVFKKANNDTVHEIVTIDDLPDNDLTTSPEFAETDIKSDKTNLNSQDVVISGDGRDFKSNELLELTQTLNLKLNLHEEEIEKVSNKISILDRILSIIIAILVIASIAIILFGIYWVSKERGLL